MKLSKLLSVLGVQCPQEAEITALTCDNTQIGRASCRERV